MSASGIAAQRATLNEAFALLGEAIVLAHAKDLRPHGTIVAAGQGALDYERYVTLLAQARYPGALVLHSLAENEVPAAVAHLRAALSGAGAPAT